MGLPRGSLTLVENSPDNSDRGIPDITTLVNESGLQRFFYSDEEEDSATHPSVGGTESQLEDGDFSAPLTRCGRAPSMGMIIEEDTSPSHHSEDECTEVEGPSNNKGALQPFRFPDCGENVRQLILKHALVKPYEIIAPYYNATSVEVEKPYMEWEDFDISLLLAAAGNRALYEEMLTALYGKNCFEFSDPKLMLWWLKRIGDNNVSRLRDIRIYFNKGEYDDLALPVRVEKIWYSVVVYLKPRHQLQRLGASFSKWEHTGEEEPDITNPRLGVYRTLFSFRGLVTAQVVPGGFVNDQNARDLVMAMETWPGVSNRRLRLIEQSIRERGTKRSMA